MMWFWIITGILVVEALLTSLLLAALIRSTWGPLSRQHPPAEPDADAIARNFQSFRFGMCSFGGCVHVVVDEQALHLRPARFLRWFGATPASIPWSAITLEKRGRSRRWATAKIDRLSVVGPAWCLDLAEPANGGSRKEPDAPDG